jgi:hypothetical protein
MGTSFQVRHYPSEGCETAPKYCTYDKSPTEHGVLSTVHSLCLSSIPFVATMGAVTSNFLLSVANFKRDPHALKTVFGKE